MTFVPTAEQNSIVAAATSTSDNLLISALAGAAKTSTLVLIAEALPSTQILSLAFNKKIATEMQERLPSNCTAKTLSSLGYSSWASFTSRRMNVYDGKMYKLIKDWAAANITDQEEREAFWENYDEIKQAVSGAKSSGYIPSIYTSAHFQSLFSDEEFLEWLDFAPSETEWQCIQEVLSESIKLGLSGSIDFDDMLYLPTLCRSATFPFFSLILVDESQDLSSLNHQMLQKLSRKGRSRIIAVGDHFQSIYGFRGAHQNSMNLLQKTFNMTKLQLTTSFRCPISVVEEARWRAPAMQYPEWAKAGLVRTVSAWDETLFEEALASVEEVAIICRNNAPLFRLALRLIKAGRFPEIVGNDLTSHFRKILTKLGAPAMPQTEAAAALTVWRDREKEKKKNHSRVDDLYDCLSAFIEDCTSLGDAIKKMEAIFLRTGHLKLMTGHKAKGLEFPSVFILDRDLIKTKDETQERNLLYVMQTRSKHTLTYITSAGWEKEA